MILTTAVKWCEKNLEHIYLVHVVLLVLEIRKSTAELIILSNLLTVISDSNLILFRSRLHSEVLTNLIFLLFNLKIANIFTSFLHQNLLDTIRNISQLYLRVFLDIL